MTSAEYAQPLKMKEKHGSVWRSTVMPGLVGGLLALAPIWVAMVLLIVLMSGCGPSNSGGGGNNNGGSCSADDPCPTGQTCVNGTCVNDDTDAGPGLCSDGRSECGGVCCDAAEVCVDDACVTDLGTCATDADCQEDSYCQDGHCIPYGTGPRGDHNDECTQLTLAGLFQPAIQCEWTGPPAGDPYPNHVRVLSTPMVVDFNLDVDANVIHPSIVVMTYDGDDGSSGFYNGATGVIRVLDGATCEQRYNVGSGLDGCNPPAIADIDMDGRPDIVAHTGYGGIVVYRYDAGTDSFVEHCRGSLTFDAQAPGWAAPSVADLDDDGVPEILSGGIVYDNQCQVLDQSLGLTGHMYRGAGYPVVADLDGTLDAQGVPSVELVTGAEVYRFDRTTRTWQTVWDGGTLQGYVAVADFGTFGADPAQDDRYTLDGIAEIVIIKSPNAYITTADGRVIYGPVPMPSGQGGGPPTVGDFDADGLPEFSCSGSDSIAVFDPDCLGTPDPQFCASQRTDGLLWWQPSQDHSSNITGSSLFDFEGDGRVEVVYADEVFTRVYDGLTGEVLFSQWHSSCTWNEYPVVADVDGDFNAELVVPSNSNCSITPETAGGTSYPAGPNGFVMDPLFVGLKCDASADCQSGVCDAGYCRCTTDAECGGTGSGFVCAAPPAGTGGAGNTCRAEWRGQYNGVRVYADVADRWVSSRTIWSQHAYAVSHISEAGHVARTSQWVQNWLTPGLNNFRQNVQGEGNPDDAPDLTGAQGKITCEVDGSATLEANACNRGTQSLGQGVPVAFYAGAPADGELLCVAETTQVLPSGSCETVSCDWMDPPSQADAVDVTVVADDDGSGNSLNSECEEGNNLAYISGAHCQAVN